MLNRSFLMIFLFLFINLAYSQIVNNRAIEPQLPLKPDWEDWNSRRNSSGGGKVRVGLMAKFDKKIKDPGRFYVQIPRTNFTVLKVLIKSFDGRYRTKDLVYSINGLKPGVHQFVLPTKYRKQLLKYDADELSILTMLFEKISDEECKHYLISGWNNKLLESDFVLNVSSRTVVQIANIENFKNKKAIDCTPLHFSSDDDRKTYYYNYKCVIPKRIILENANLVLLKSSNFNLPKSYPIPYLIK